MKQTLSLLLLAWMMPLMLFAQSRQPEPAEKPMSHAQVVSPNIPDYVVFCGDTIRLNRYDLRERLDRELTSFCYTHATTLMIFKRANRIFPEVEPILKANNVPTDFKYLMVIESNLIATSKSGVGAAGYWQFMEGTAKEYGLVVNATVDERYNTEKATAAACKYLKDAKRVCGDWISAAASYNAGQQRIALSLKNQERSRPPTSGLTARPPVISSVSSPSNSSWRIPVPTASTSVRSNSIRRLSTMRLSSPLQSLI